MSQFETLAVINIRDGAFVYKIADIAIKDGFLPGKVICFGVRLDYAKHIVEAVNQKAMLDRLLAEGSNAQEM
jgi:hypothetical protein